MQTICEVPEAVKMALGALRPKAGKNNFGAK